MNKKEVIVLQNFLKSGYSTRQLDKLLGHKTTKGWISWEILKIYKLKNSDKGKLFLYSNRQSKEIISVIMKEKKESLIEDLIKMNLPRNLEKYKNTFVIAESEKNFYNIMSGETRNIIRDFFNPEKKLIGKCQFKECNEKKGQIDTVHLRKDRPEIFMECAEKYKEANTNKLFKYDVYKTMKCFLISHAKPKSICFLCKKHHCELHKIEKLSKQKLKEFKNKIIF
ncbi:hypothetical protein HOC35_06470 [Candidatus Woesearchaeota archaeon]|jgi:hypothetical protein|nr:hypothetical protein [Candidatus Woesearchaeota archaeon]